MKLKYLVSLALASCCGLADAGDTPAFYVVDLRHTGDAVLHSSSRSPVPRPGLPFVVLQSAEATCCFSPGLRPGQRKPPLKIDEDAPPLSSEEGDETFQFSGFVTRPSVVGDKDRIAFGLEGMSGVTLRGKNSYEIATGGKGKVYVRHCLGSEGVNFRLYHTAKDRNPYATYYFALGYPVKPDCR
jgi:hypothetical protein